MSTIHDRCESRIRTLEAEQQRSAARAVEAAQEYSRNLAAARAITTRLRESLLAGHLDVTQARFAWRDTLAAWHTPLGRITAARLHARMLAAVTDVDAVLRLAGAA